MASLRRNALLALVAAASAACPPTATAAPDNGICWTNDELERKIDASFAGARRSAYGECPDLADLPPHPPCSHGGMALAYYRAWVTALSCTEPPTVVAQLHKVSGTEAFEMGEVFYFGGYKGGTYISKNDRVAHVYYRKGGDHAAALTALGYMYQTGQGSEQSSAHAKEVYERAVELLAGRPPAATTVARLARMAPHQLGRMYEDGSGVSRDDQAAFRYYSKGRDAGEPWSVYRLGLCYALGKGTTQNLRWALTLFEAIVQRERMRADQTVVRAAEDAARKAREALATTAPNAAAAMKPPACNYVVKARVQNAGFQLDCE
jgi:TPR repeat protein